MLGQELELPVVDGCPKTARECFCLKHHVWALKTSPKAENILQEWKKSGETPGHGQGCCWMEQGTDFRTELDH